ncbi:MAG: DNA mismatch repair protein MutS [Candidatus Dormiibacterota bacterium]
MKAHLMYRDRDFDLGGPGRGNEWQLTQDFDLTALFEAMARGDKFLFEVSRRAVLSSLCDPAAIQYRQEILDDSVRHADAVAEMYALAVAAVVGEHSIWAPFRKSPSGVLRRSIDALQLFVGHLRRLRQIADQQGDEFRSPGFATFFAMLRRELDDQYFQTVDTHLQRLKLKDGMVISAQLGPGNKGEGLVLRTPGLTKQSWREWLGLESRSSLSFEVSDRDEAGLRALSELTDRGTTLVANALAQSTDHILSFFTLLRAELGFYVSCLNLRQHLTESGAPVCTPVALPSTPLALTAKNLYDICLRLRKKGEVVGNDVGADGKSLVMITGANSGGKSTFLRSVGLAQLMMQSGMFVAADSYQASVFEGLFTHFIREEDASMRSGRLDEELSRMSEIADQLAPGYMVLFNESFAATNEREGSEIAGQIVHALLEAGIRILFVTHLFEFADGIYQQHLDSALFLRAERRDDGRRTFRLLEAEPVPTSYGEDIYRRLGGWGRAPRTEDSALRDPSSEADRTAAP